MDVDRFITRWTSREGGAERANYQMFLSELCDVLGVPRPDPASADHDSNDYVFERSVRSRANDPFQAQKRIDLYRRDAFILEAKQSRLPGKKNAIPGQTAAQDGEPEELGRRSVARGWDAMMQNAKAQAQGYVFLLDAQHPAPPFLITCDVGHCLEVFADFTGTGRAYDQFPDRQGFRIYLEDLRKPAIRERLARIWTEPHGLDPAKTSARVTREIARRLAEVGKALEARGCNAEDVAHFLMRCLFTMFAEDVGLLPNDSFKTLLKKSVEDPGHFPHRLKSLWHHMDGGQDYSFVIDARVRKFNGGLFNNTTVFELETAEIGELLAAANHRWTAVDPAIFGTLLEQALDRTERRKLGAHYTPRAYVRRLVDVTVMEPLRMDWQGTLTKARQAKEDGDEKGAVAIVRGFHRQLCATHVLDPACGTGNFLYVALELMKTLEGEVLETLAELGEPESMGFDRETVDPHQFLGLELNPRAAAIAELVVWIGYLQQHYRTRTGHPGEPILKTFTNINFGLRQGYDAVLTWDGYPVPGVASHGGVRRATYPQPARPAWPEAAFIVGNPPFIGGKDLRARMPEGYVEALWAAHPQMNESADFVMYWWDRAAEILARKGSPLRRFGFVTTNSISQVFQRRVMQRHLHARAPISLVLAIPDHPWTRSTRDAATVRIAMTVAEAGLKTGLRLEVAHESGLESDEPLVLFTSTTGTINENLSIGADVSAALPLLGNKDLAHQGIIPVGEGFRLDRAGVMALGYDPDNLPPVIRPYLIGRDLVQGAPARYIIDFFGLSEREARLSYPKLFAVVLERVKPQRDIVRRMKTRQRYWIHAEPRSRLRAALIGLDRYIVTCRTAKHRIFSFAASGTLPDTKIVALALDGAHWLAVLSSHVHTLWSHRTGGFLEDRPTYQHAECFAKFPFPVLSSLRCRDLAAAGEDLDALRKRVQAEHPDLTLTGLYNVLAAIKAGTALTAEQEDVKRRGLVRILETLHAGIDAIVMDAYGWPPNLSDDAIVARLVALTADRARSEGQGDVHWLRPAHQVPRFAKESAAPTSELPFDDGIVAIDQALPVFPADRYEQPLAVELMLAGALRPVTAFDLARGFRRGGRRIEARVAQVLTTLARYGRVSALEGGRYVARKAA